MAQLPTPLLIAISLCGFAANSLLCRAALGTDSVDAFTFTAIRLVSGALILSVLARGRGLSSGGSWNAAFALFAYALCFALAYRSMTAATGALLLFATVQLTMMGYGLARGERLTLLQKAGFSLACIGLLVLTLPGAEAPGLGSALLMIVAGAAWACYSLIGRGSQSPLTDSAANFGRASVLGLIFLGLAFFPGELHANGKAVALAIGSGAFASGLAYAIWYRVLPKLDAWQAGVLQLLTPILAAGGGFLLLAESVPLRVLLATALVLFGLACSLKQKSRVARRSL